MDERIEQPVVRIDQIHASGSFTNVVIEVLDGDRGVRTVKGQTTVDHERTLSISIHIAEAAELNAAGTAADNEVFELSRTVYAKQAVTLKLKRCSRQNLVDVGVLLVANGVRTPIFVGGHRAVRKRNEARKIDLIISDCYVLIGENNFVILDGTIKNDV